MNTTTLVEKMIKEGKAKIGKCEYSKCTNNSSDDLLYRVKTDFICGECLDRIDKLIKKAGL